MPQAHHHIHVGGPQYAPPVLRAPSPSSSIGTEYGPDDTSLSDRELSQEEFDKKCEERLHLHEPRLDEIRASDDILIRPRPKNANEEKEVFDSVMKKLRERVKQLEDDELLEATMLRGTQIDQEQQPSSDDIDVIMRGLMATSCDSPSTAHFPSATTTWGASVLTAGGSTATTAGKRSTKSRTNGRKV